MAGLRPQFIDAVPQVIGERSSQLVSEFGEPVDGGHTLRIDLRLTAAEFSQPVEHRHPLRGLLKEDDSDPRHPALSILSQYCDN